MVWLAALTDELEGVIRRSVSMGGRVSRPSIPSTVRSELAVTCTIRADVSQQRSASRHPVLRSLCL